METGLRETGAQATDEPPDGRLDLTPGVSAPAEPVRLQDLELRGCLERAWAGEHISGLVAAIHIACHEHFHRCATLEMVPVRALFPGDAFARTYATWQGMRARLEVHGPRAVALEWLNVFGWLVVDECHRLREAAGEPGSPPLDLGALQRIEDRWHPELRSACCGGGTN